MFTDTLDLATVPALRGPGDHCGPHPTYQPGMTICRAAWRYWLLPGFTQAALEIDGVVSIVWSAESDYRDGWQPTELAAEVRAALGGWVPDPTAIVGRVVAVAPAELSLWRAAVANPRVHPATRAGRMRKAVYSTNGDPELLALLASEVIP